MVDTAPSENEYQEYFLVVKTAGAWSWRPHHLHVPNVRQIWESIPPGTLWATPGLLRDSFTKFYSQPFNVIHNPFFHHESSGTQCTDSGRPHIRSYFQVLWLMLRVFIAVVRNFVKYWPRGGGPLIFIYSLIYWHQLGSKWGAIFLNLLKIHSTSALCERCSVCCLANWELVWAYRNLLMGRISEWEIWSLSDIRFLNEVKKH